MLEFFKSAFQDETKEKIIQNDYIEEAKKYHGGRAYTFYEAYNMDRENKNQYIKENLIANDYDYDEFLALLAKEKGIF